MKVKVQDGKVTVGRHDLRDKIAKLEDGYYNFEIEEWKDSRSLQQNRLFWSWMTIMGNHHGMTKDEMHDEMIDRFAPVYTRRTIEGKPKQEKMGTSKMNVKQMHEFMQQVDQFAAEWGTVLPQPDDQLLQSIIDEFDAVET